MSNAILINGKPIYDLIAEYKATLKAKTAEEPTLTPEEALEKAYEDMIGGKAESQISAKLSKQAINGLHNEHGLPDLYGASWQTLSCPTGQGIAVFNVAANVDSTSLNFGPIVFFKESEKLYHDAQEVNHPRFGGRYVRSSAIKSGLRANSVITRWDRETQDFIEPDSLETLVVSRLLENRDNWTIFETKIEK